MDVIHTQAGWEAYPKGIMRLYLNLWSKHILKGLVIGIFMSYLMENVKEFLLLVHLLRIILLFCLMSPLLTSICQTVLTFCYFCKSWLVIQEKPYLYPLMSWKLLCRLPISYGLWKKVKVLR